MKDLRFTVLGRIIHEPSLVLGCCSCCWILFEGLVLSLSCCVFLPDVHELLCLLAYELVFLLVAYQLRSLVLGSGVESPGYWAFKSISRLVSWFLVLADCWIASRFLCFELKERSKEKSRKAKALLLKFSVRGWYVLMDYESQPKGCSCISLSVEGTCYLTNQLRAKALSIYSLVRVWIC